MLSSLVSTTPGFMSFAHNYMLIAPETTIITVFMYDYMYYYIIIIRINQFFGHDCAVTVLCSNQYLVYQWKNVYLKMGHWCVKFTRRCIFYVSANQRDLSLGNPSSPCYKIFHSSCAREGCSTTMIGRLAALILLSTLCKCTSFVR